MQTPLFHSNFNKCSNLLYRQNNCTNQYFAPCYYGNHVSKLRLLSPCMHMHGSLMHGCHGDGYRQNFACSKSSSCRHDCGSSINAKFNSSPVHHARVLGSCGKTISLLEYCDINFVLLFAVLFVVKVNARFLLAKTRIKNINFVPNYQR